MVKYQLQQIPCTQIGPSFFTTRFYRDDRGLNTSIQSFGVLNPPRVIVHERLFWILDGQARIEAARKMGQAKLSCLVCEYDPFDLREIFLHCLELNRWDREFNLAERASCLQRAQTIFDSPPPQTRQLAVEIRRGTNHAEALAKAGLRRDVAASAAQAGQGYGAISLGNSGTCSRVIHGPTIPKHFWEIVGIKEDIRTVHQHKEFLKLPEVIQKYAVVHDIPLQVVLNFLRFPPAQIEAIAAQLFLLPLNRNKLSEILSLLLDVTKREGLLPLDVLNAFLKTLEGEKNLFKKEEKLRELLQLRRNPEYSKQLQAFQVAVKDLSLGESVQVEPTPFFEDEAVVLNAKISSLEDRDALIKKLQEKGWEKILKNEE